MNYVFPAHAGMSLNRFVAMITQTSFPRSRGDEPQCRMNRACSIVFSPLTRG